jgi:hypothetical protein
MTAVEELRATYNAWNNPPSEGLPPGADILLRAADALEAALSERDEWRANATEFKELCSEWEARVTALEKVLGLVDKWDNDTLNDFLPPFIGKAVRAALSPKLGEEKR